MTSSERYERVVQLFGFARRLEPAQRSAYLERECREDDLLHQEVERMLARHAGDDSFFDHPPEVSFDAEAFTGAADHVVDLSGTRIGPYRLTRVINAGGMGTVYEAMQENPRRTVALKVMRADIASAGALRRFRYESEILARLRHPGIAHVYEADTWSADSPSGGAPYFVMEYVPEAKAITEYTDDEGLGTNERLELFLKVCHAVHHGHQKGVIHRDLKPANILVDANGEPKVIDFGVARATDSDMAVTMLLTDVGQLIGTLQYMSPEQCESDPRELDTRSDVYALGVVLFELLSGRLPYDVTNVPLHEAVQVVREATPICPSTIDRALRGDLETIMLKALEKDPGRRYQSALDLAQDIRRHLNHEMIMARPPSAMYQLRKFATRHRALTSSLLAAMVVLVAGMTTTTWQAVRAIRSESVAVTARDEAEAVTQFLVEMLGVVDPHKVGFDARVQLVLDEASRALDTGMAGSPVIEARLRDTIGLIYLKLGLYPPAERHLARALEIRRPLLGEAHPHTLESMNKLAMLYSAQGRHDEAEPLYLQTLEGRKQVLGEQDADTARSMGNLAILYQERGDFDQAEPLHDRALAITRRIRGEDHEETMTALSNLAEMYERAGRYEQAEELHRHVLEVRRGTLGEEHLDTAESMRNVATLFAAQGRFEDAEQLDLEALEIIRNILGPEHPATLRSMANLARAYATQRRYEEAEQILLRVVDAANRVLGEEHPFTLSCKHDLANVLWSGAHHEEALELITEVLDARRRRLGNDHPDTLKSMNTKADVLMQFDGTLEESESLYREAWQATRELLGDEHPDTLALYKNLGRFYEDTEHYAEARPLLIHTLQARRTVLGDAHPLTLSALENLARLCRKMHRYEDAEPLYAQLAELTPDEPSGAPLWPDGGPEHDLSAFLSGRHAALHNLAFLYQQWRRFDDARSIYLEALDIRRRVLGAAHRETLNTMTNLAVVYQRLGHYDDAERLHGETLRQKHQVLGEADRDTLASQTNLAILCSELGRLKEAEQLLDGTLATMPQAWAEKPGEGTTWTQDPYLRICISALAEVYKRQGRHEDAEPLYLDLVDLSRRGVWLHPQELWRRISCLAHFYGELGRLVEAEQLYQEILRRGEHREEHRDILSAATQLAHVHFRQGRLREAVRRLRETLTVKRRVLGERDPLTRRCMRTLVEVYLAQGRDDLAEPMLKDYLAMCPVVTHSVTSSTLTACIRAGGSFPDFWPGPVDLAAEASELDDEDWARAALADLLVRQDRLEEAQALNGRR